MVKSRAKRRIFKAGSGEPDGEPHFGVFVLALSAFIRVHPCPMVVLPRKRLQKKGQLL